ncbi:MAG TPA: GAF domain-containing protein [Vicinamibacteria bacterium]|nr:GAF domain-containing protein [Vicinamibacteria bacterium]
MTLQEDLKAKALGLISQQMANWVVDIQRQIGEHQGNLVRALDDLQESVARYDERINEGDIEMAMAEVVATIPPPEPAAPSGPGFDQLKSSLAALEKGTSLSEVLTHLVNEVSQYVDRAAMFIVKGPSAIGWYARGVEPGDIIKQVNVPLNADTVLRNVNNSRHALRGAMAHSPGTAQALARMGGNPQSVLAVPLILRDKLAAILYCDSALDEVPPPVADLIEVLVLFAGKTIDMLSLAPKTAAPAAATSAPTVPPMRVNPPPAARPAAAATPAPPDEGGSTVMFNASQMSAFRPQGAATPRAQAPPPPPPPSPAMSPEETKAHEDAKRFARLVVSEIKLYNEAKVNEGRRNKDIYERLKEDIERGRQMYADRVAPPVRDSTNYFYDELVRILAGGDQSALGPM